MIDAQNVFFAGIRGKVPDATLAEMASLVNKSPTMLAEIDTANRNQISLDFSSATNPQAGDFQRDRGLIELPNPSAYVAQDTGADGHSTPMSLAQSLVGVIAHELGHFLDGDLRQAFTIDNGVALGIVGEGKALLRPRLRMVMGWGERRGGAGVRPC